MILLLDIIIATFSIGVWVYIYSQTQAKGVLLIVAFMVYFNVHIISASFIKKKKVKSESEVEVNDSKINY